MKRISIILTLIVFLSTSCQKYLDVNTNPNSATTATPELILPQAIVYTASVANSYNSYGAQLGGYMANAYGYGGFGNNFSYTFNSSDYTGLWSASYDVLNDFQYVLNSTNDATNRSYYAYYRAAALIMQVYNYQLLVDTYNNIPFTNALKGTGSLTPSYDDAKTIYPKLSNMLDTAIAYINAAPSSAKPLGVGKDPLFNKSAITVTASANLWKQFANTLKLRLIVRAAAKITMPSTTFDAVGFLATDAVVNPGFARANASSGTQVNPEFNTWVATYSGGKGNRSWVPTKWIYSFYSGTKLLDAGRGNAIFYGYATNTTGLSQLGVILSGGSSNGNTSNWYCSSYGAPTSLTTVGSNIGVMKGPDMGQPLMLAAESYLLQAEAVVRAIPNVTGSDATLFNNGVTASFNYLYLLPNGALGAGLNVATSVAAYQAANPTSYLVNYALAGTTAQKIEAIITQKYLAVNMINSNEGWNEYRRTGYPTIVPGSVNATLSFASTQSSATRADKLPTRLQYPISEFSYNAANVPNVNVLTDLIFWAQ
ncbi:MAG: SusD/RagB family nutrient-binding outer membrane lipoprotein [Bacteroidetes bacterium]|nr:SusD/RagB family nutrient-binding outer membrane lipoprotein [Bacteroidota bacterium]MBS1670819.1 SusD/RagB family nutrient-binding outer membrane lipoprotein [Bacteroidota bacterium]